MLSIVSFFCGITAPFGAYIGWNEKKAIDAGRRDPKNRGMAIAALVIGAIGTALLLLGVLFFILVIVLAAGSSA